MRKRRLSKEESLVLIRDYLSYDSETGFFVWIKIPYRSKVNLFKPIIIHRRNGYLSVQFAGYRYPTHVLAWWFYYNEFPNGEIDHINGIRGDNRISNLRIVNRSENCRNCVRHREGKHVGIYWSKKYSRYESRYLINNEWKFLGYYDSVEEALTARNIKQREVNEQ